jgi:hypothetical protein
MEFNSIQFNESTFYFVLHWATLIFEKKISPQKFHCKNKLQDLILVHLSLAFLYLLILHGMKKIQRKERKKNLPLKRKLCPSNVPWYQPGHRQQISSKARSRRAPRISLHCIKRIDMKTNVFPFHPSFPPSLQFAAHSID